MTMTAAKKARKAVVNGTEHTDASLAAMKTSEVAGLVAAIRGDGKTPKPATKAKAIEPLLAGCGAAPADPGGSQGSRGARRQGRGPRREEGRPGLR